MASKFYEKGFSPRTEVEGLEYMGEAKPGYLEGMNASPSFKKYNYEAQGEGSKGPAAK